MIHPFLVLEIPFYGFLNTLLKLEKWLSVEFLLQLSRVDSITHIVPLYICYISDEIHILAFLSAELTEVVFVTILCLRQFSRNTGGIRNSISRTSHTLPYTYQDFQYQIYLPSFSRHASPLVPPCNEQDYLGHPCHNHSPQNVLPYPNPYSIIYRMVAQPNGSLAPEASPPYSIPCRYHPTR